MERLQELLHSRALRQDMAMGDAQSELQAETQDTTLWKPSCGCSTSLGILVGCKVTTMNARSSQANLQEVPNISSGSLSHGVKLGEEPSFGSV